VTDAGQLRALVLTAIVVVSVVAGGVAVSERTAAQSESDTLVVDKSDSDAYDSIQAAVNDAGDGDRIEVQPGTYEESLRLTENVTIVAPEGATLANGSSAANPVGVSISEDASPTLSGLTLTGWRWGIGAWRGDGDWTLRNSRIEGGETAVGAGDTTGAWTVRNSVVTNSSDDGVDAYSSTGAWTIRNSVVANSSDDGIDAAEANGTWTVRDTTIRGSEDGHGIAGYDTTGEWRVTNVTISDVVRGISVDGSVGDWTVERTTVRDSYVGLDTYETTGNWTARDIVVEGSEHGINAYNTSGDWVIRNATVLGSNSNGILAGNSAGDWTARDVVIEGGEDGIDAWAASGNWVVRNATVLGSNDNGVHAGNSTGRWVIRDSRVEGGDAAVFASRSSEQWTIRNTTLDAPTGVNATNAVVAGDAAYNYWGAADGPSGDFPGSGAGAYGNVSVEPFYTDEALTTLSNGETVTRRTDVVDTGDTGSSGASGGGGGGDGAAAQSSPGQADVDRQAGEGASNSPENSDGDSEIAGIRQFERINNSTDLPLGIIGIGSLAGLFGLGAFWRLRH
jgi:pectinesterase